MTRGAGTVACATPAAGSSPTPTGRAPGLRTTPTGSPSTRKRAGVTRTSRGRGRGGTVPAPAVTRAGRRPRTPIAPTGTRPSRGRRPAGSRLGGRRSRPGVPGISRPVQKGPCRGIGTPSTPSSIAPPAKDGPLSGRVPKEVTSITLGMGTPPGPCPPATGTTRA